MSDKERLLDIIQPAGYDFITACAIANDWLASIRDNPAKRQTYWLKANNGVIKVHIRRGK